MRVAKQNIIRRLLPPKHTGDPRYMRTFYLPFHIYVIKIMAYQRNISSNLPMLLVSLYANSLYASQFFGSLSIEYNEGRLYIHLKRFKK